MADLVIPLHDLDTAGKDFSFALVPAWLDRVLQGTGVSGDASQVGEVHVHAQRNGREILIHGRAKAQLVTECGRCLKGMPLSLETELGALYAPAEIANKRGPVVHDDEDIELSDEPDVEVYTGDKVEIDDLVRDSLLLELPMQPRCDLGWACPNIDLPEHLRAAEGVSTKGFDVGNTDPRLLPLMKLAKGEPDKE